MNFVAHKVNMSTDKTADFAQRWGLNRSELVTSCANSSDFARIATIQFVVLLLIMYTIRPTFVMIKETPETVDRFHFGAAVAICIIIVLLTAVGPVMSK